MPDLPPVIATFFATAPDVDRGTLGTIFTAEAHVHDEAHDYHGLDEISAWRVDTATRTPFTARPLEIDQVDGAHIVKVEVSGSFPNSPLLLDHRFTLTDGLIASLDIG